MNSTSAPQDRDSVGSRSRPYVARLPPSFYKANGERLGLSTGEDEVEDARQADDSLGVRRFLPSQAEGSALPIPPGEFVDWRVDG